MRCNYSFLCDFAQDTGGKIGALGIGWGEMNVASVPVIHQQMGFVASLEGTIAEAGMKKIELSLIDADGSEIIPKLEADMEFIVNEPALEGRLNLIFMLNQIQFPKFGQYAFHLVVQGNEIAQQRFTVVPIPTTN